MGQYQAQTGMVVLEAPVEVARMVRWFEAQNGMDEPEMPQAHKNEMAEQVAWQRHPRAA